MKIDCQSAASKSAANKKGGLSIKGSIYLVYHSDIVYTECMKIWSVALQFRCVALGRV